MALEFQTFINPTTAHSGGPVGGLTLFKALGHPLAAEQGPALLAKLAQAKRLAVYDPFAQAAVADPFYGLSELDISEAYVQAFEEIGRDVLGRKACAIADISASDADLLLVTAFDAARLIDHIRPYLPDGMAVISFDALRLPDEMLSRPEDYLAAVNFATNFAFLRDEPGHHSAIVTVNYWSLYGAKQPALWLRLFNASGDVLADWRQSLAPAGGTIRIDSRAVRERFKLEPFCGSLFIHALGIAGHDVVKYALDTFGDDGKTLSCSHDANAWPADLYAGLPAPAPGERVLLWVQNSHPIPIPADGIGLNLMGRDEVRRYSAEIPPFGTQAIDCGALFPEAAWPDQFEVQAGKYFVRPRYEVIQGNGRRRFSHANVERTDLKPDGEIPKLDRQFGKGYLMPLPVPPLDSFRSQALPTPMATSQSELPIAFLLYDASGAQIGERYLGRVARSESALVELDDWLEEAALALPSRYGHMELVYDFREGGAADGWLHAIGRYTHRESGHAAETSFGAHIFNVAATYRGEPQSYAGRPPGLSTRLFLRLGEGEADTFCHLIYPASRPWRETSATDLNLIDGAGNMVAGRRVEIPCSGSRFWRYHETFDAAERAAAGPGAYVQVRDATCRLFGYHGLLLGEDSFSLDHMFGF